MRDEFGEIDPDEIDLIDPVGTPMGEPSDSTPPPTVAASPPLHRRRWAIPAAVIAVAAAGVAVAVWQPWSDGDDGTVSFPGDTLVTPTLTEELVFGDPPGELSSVSLGLSSGEQGNGALFGADSEGYFFAAPGASFEFGQGSGTWAAFLSVPDGSEDAPDITVDDEAPPIRVQGAPASFNNDAAAGAETFEIDFGPVGGRLFSVITSGIGRGDSLRFAEAIGVEGGIPVVRDSTVLGEMQPVGSLQAYAATFQLYASAFSPLPGMQGAVAVRYGADDQVSSVASIPAPAEDPFPMVRFVLGGEAKDVTVHGLPAVAVDGRELGNVLGFEQGQSTVVTWVEGGRLVMVTGPGDIAATVALAETVRAASDDEWAAVIQRSNTQPDPTLVGGDPADEGVALTVGVDPDSQAQYTFTATMTATDLSMCVQEVSGDGGSGSSCDAQPLPPLPVLTTVDWRGHRFALAVVAAGEADSPELHITNADGTVEIRPLDDRGDAFPGPVVGVLLPDDVETVELYNAGDVVASL